MRPDLRHTHPLTRTRTPVAESTRGVDGGVQSLSPQVLRETRTGGCGVRRRGLVSPSGGKEGATETPRPGLHRRGRGRGPSSGTTPSSAVSTTTTATTCAPSGGRGVGPTVTTPPWHRLRRGTYGYRAGTSRRRCRRRGPCSCDEVGPDSGVGAQDRKGRAHHVVGVSGSLGRAVEDKSWVVGLWTESLGWGVGSPGLYGVVKSRGGSPLRGGLRMTPSARRSFSGGRCRV